MKITLNKFKTIPNGNIPENWDLSNIGSSYLKGRIGWQGLTTKEYLDDGQYYLVTGTDFDNGKVKWDTCHFVEKKRYSQDSKIQLKDEDIIVTKDGTIGKVAYVDKVPLPATLNSGVFVIRPINKEYIPKFLYYVLRSFIFDKFIENLSAGSTIKHLYQKDFVKFVYPLPKEKEQEKIINIFSIVDESIEYTEQLINKYKSIKQGLMQDLFKFGIDENGQIRSENTHKFKDSSLGRIPDEWYAASIPELLKNQAGSMKIGPFGSQLKKEYFVEHGFKVYGQENAFTKDFSIGERYIDKTRFNMLKSCELKQGDFIISMMGTIGKCAIVPEDVERGIMDSHLIRLQINESKYNKKLLGFLIEEFPVIKNQMINLSVGGIMQGLSTKIIKQLTVPMPDINEQMRIVEIMGKINTSIQSEEKYFKKLSSIKHGLMQDLLTGKVRVNHLLN